MDKTEIARRQIHGAIRSYFVGGDPVVIASLVSPASQILRDLNKNNPRAFSSLITELANEHNHPPGKIWSEFNQTANVLKHANDPSERLDFEKIASQEEQIGALCFCIGEYQANAGRVSHYMEAFCYYMIRRKRRANVEKWPTRILDVLDRHFTLWRLDRRTSVSWPDRAIITGAKAGGSMVARLL